jgi:hypothetical protein
MLLALEMEKLRFRFRRVIARLFITVLSQLLFQLALLNAPAIKPSKQLLNLSHRIFGYCGDIFDVMG